MFYAEIKALNNEVLRDLNNGCLAGKDLSQKWYGRPPTTRWLVVILFKRR